MRKFIPGVKDKSMKTIYGVLCCVAFTLTSAAYHPFQEAGLETKVAESVPADSSATAEGQTGDEEVQKAARLVAVTTKQCPPCRRLKYLTITVLLAEGYDVAIVDHASWDGPAPDRYPTLYYYDQYGWLIRTEEGFKTAAHIKKYLDK